MKSKMLVLLLVCICLLSCSTVYAEGAESTATTTAEESTEDDGCNTAEELHAFLKSNEGGTVTLTGDILWDYTYNDLPRITQPTVVEMGTYKICIPAECMMQIQGSVTFRGEGAVLFETAGLLNLSYGVEVLSTGENAVAIQRAWESDLQLFICNISASGANSTAIQSTQPVTIQLCHISGTKAAIEAPEITLDASSVSHELTEATVIERVPTLDRSLRLYGITLPVDVSQDQYKEAIYGYGDLQYAFIDSQTGNSIGGSLGCEWLDVPAWPAKAGSYTFTVKPVNLPDWFPVEIPSFDIPLHIVDKNTLWLSVGYADPRFGMLALQFMPNISDETSKVTLFYSTDEGKTWKNVIEEFPDSTVRPDFIDVVGLESNTNYWFYAEVTGGSLTGKSNIIYHPNFANYLDVDFSHGGGDRDEDDFGDQGEKPPAGEIIPSTDTDSSTDTTTTPPTDTMVPLETNTTTDTATKPVSDSISEPTSDATSETISESTVDKATRPTQQPDNSEPGTSGNGETNTQQGDAIFPRTFDMVLIILSLVVVGGIVCVLLLWRKGGRR